MCVNALHLEQAFQLFMYSPRQIFFYLVFFLIVIIIYADTIDQYNVTDIFKNSPDVFTDASSLPMK